MDNNLIISIIAIIGSIFSLIIGILNHKRCRSKCFSEKEIILSLDVENTTPQSNKLKIKLPESPKEEIKDDVKYG
jgi:hypothetical protein